MAEPRPDSDRPEAAEPDGFYGLTPERLHAVREALAQNRIAEIEAITEALHPADVADLLENLSGEERPLYLAITRHIIDPETLSYLDETVREEVIDFIGPREMATMVSELDSDDAVDLLEDLDDAAKRRILDAIPAQERVLLEEGLTFPEESAGRLMQREMVAVPSWWTVGETVDFLRANEDLPDDFYNLYIVDPTHKPVGAVPLSRALRARRAVRLTEIMESDLRCIPAAMDQEAVAHLFRQYGLVSAPVVDEGGRLLGVVTVDDVVHVIDEEAEEDLLGIVGVGDTDFHLPAYRIAWLRVRWLVVTLINTAIASTVISQFTATIEQIVALAVLMPIVAAMGGNAGVQVITVMVRALATRDLSPTSNPWRIIGKELLVGAMNAVVFAAIMGTVAALWFHNAPLGLVLAGAMIFNMMWAGLAGTLIPLTLARLGVDPAIGAGPFLTTTTDVLGFFSFLGLATLFLL